MNSIQSGAHPMQIDTTTVQNPFLASGTTQKDIGSCPFNQQSAPKIRSEPTRGFPVIRADPLPPQRWTSWLQPANEETDALLKREQFAISLRKQKKAELLAAKRAALYERISNMQATQERVASGQQQLVEEAK